MDSYPYIKPGDEITLDTTIGLTGLCGEVVAVDRSPDGSLRCLSIREAGSDRPPLRIAGQVVALWRLGKPLQRRVAHPLAIPAGQVPLGLLGNNHP